MRAVLLVLAALMLTAFVPPPNYVVPTTMIDVIKHLGFTSGLKLVLDAGDANSYATGQKWLDTSGNGYDFFRGQDNSATASDPTFNGVAGRQSSAEFFGLDGGDWFTYDTTHESWMQNLHKDSAKFTIAMWFKDIGTAGSGFLLGDESGTPGACIVIYANSTSSGKLEFYIKNAVGISSLIVTSDDLVADGAWMFGAITLDEAAGTGTIQLRGTQKSFTSTYVSPGGDSSGHLLQIGANGTDGFEPLPSGSKMNSVMIWESVALTAAQLTTLYNATKGKFGL